ncbi:MAG: hypothetical protein WCK91_01665 [bacterium]
MENSFQTSFIPKKSIVTTSVVRRAPTKLIIIISVGFLVIVLVTVGGLFLYKNYLLKQKAQLSSSLVSVRDYFDKDNISELQLFDKRMSASKQILSTHTVLSPLFSVIGDTTIPAVQYTSFDQQTTDKGFFVTMQGVAIDYKSVALQASVFNSSKGRYFKDVVFSNLSRNSDNYITFDIDFSVDPSLLSYEKDNQLQKSIPANNQNH